MSKTQRCSRAVVVAVLAGAAIMVCGGTVAYGEPVRYDNLPEGAPGWFNWWSPNPNQGRRWLDVMADVANQPLGAPLSAINPEATFGQSDPNASTGHVLAGGDDLFAGLQVGGEDDYFLVGVGAGDLIPSGSPWDGMGAIYSPYYTPPSELPVGDSYLGVRFDTGAGLQYGWIGVTKTYPTDPLLDTFAWGYETVPGVPIAAGIPEPGTLALLAFGVAAVTRRRR